MYLVLHGPNLNLLGQREPEVYGNKTLKEINDEICIYSKKIGLNIDIFQSNHEGEIVDFIHDDNQNCSGMVINPAALTHYSISLRDAIAAVNIPTLEVHLSNIYNREQIRSKSVISPVVRGTISGLGYRGYLYALDFLSKIIEKEKWLWKVE